MHPKLFYRLFASTALATIFTLFPNWIVHRHVQLYTVPFGSSPRSVSPVSVASVPSAMPQQAQAFSGSVPVYRNEFEREYAQSWQLVRGYFLYQERLHNWAEWRHKYDNQLNNEADCESAINAMVDSLHDEYTFFRDVEETSLREREEDSRGVVTWKRVSPRVGYIHIATFSSKNCVEETKKALIALRGQGALILDLRNNCGGSISNAAQVFSLFVDRGRFVEMRGVAGEKPYLEVVEVRSKSISTVENGFTTVSFRELNYAGHKPLQVIVDKTTKSAAEMLAGALRDNKRAKIIGGKSFGKGVIQRIWQFEQGTSIKITAAKYYFPGGENIHGVGIKPDVFVATSRSGDAPMRNAITRANQDLLLKRANSKHS